VYLLRLFVAGRPEEVVGQLHRYWELGCREFMLGPTTTVRQQAGAKVYKSGFRFQWVADDNLDVPTDDPFEDHFVTHRDFFLCTVVFEQALVDPLAESSRRAGALQTFRQRIAQTDGSFSVAFASKMFSGSKGHLLALPPKAIDCLRALPSIWISYLAKKRDQVAAKLK